MWAYAITAPGRLERVEAPVPEAGPGRVLVRHAGGICGSGRSVVLFSHALKARGAAWVTGVDRLDRGDVAAAFGVDEPVWDDASAWARGLGEERPEIVVEAIGHHAGPVAGRLKVVLEVT
jgi:hypothetical protein